MKRDSLLDLAAGWREDADLLRNHGAVEAATTSELHARQVINAVERAEDERLTVPEAALESGFAERTIRQQIAERKLENVGAKGRPRVRRGDLPMRAKSKKGSDFDAATEARQILGGTGEPA